MFSHVICLKFKNIWYIQKPKTRYHTQNHLIRKRTLNHLTIELCCEYLSVWCIWLYVIIMSRTRFKLHPCSTFAWISRNSLLEISAISEVYVTVYVNKHSAIWLYWRNDWAVVSTYLYGAFDCVLLSCNVRLSEWIHTIYLPEC